MQKLKKLIASGSEKEAHKGTMEDVLPRAIVHAELGTDENIFASPTLQGLYSKALLWSWSLFHATMGVKVSLPSRSAMGEVVDTETAPTALRK